MRSWPTSARVTAAALVGLLALAALLVGRDGADAPPTSPPTTSTPAPPTTGSPPTPTPSTAPAPSPPTSSPAPTTAELPIDLGDRPVAQLLDGLVVAEPGPEVPRYQRDLMDGGDWAYDPATGCNTRERVLVEESLVAPTVDDRCRSTGGRWRSAYDGVETDDVADLQIDHLVPLADAWRSGAWRWTSEQRLAFSNDLSSPDTLIAVTGSTNTSKSDSTPADWLPPDRSAWCEYASAWVRVKARWALSVAPAEKAALANVLGGC